MIRTNFRNIAFAVIGVLFVWMGADYYGPVIGFLVLIAAIAVSILLFMERPYSRLPQMRARKFLRPNMTPDDFEEAVAERMRLDGWDAEVMGGSGDGGIDVKAINRDGQTAIVQCKYYGPNSTVTPAQVRELAGSWAISGANIASMVTTGYLSSQARDEARSAGIEVIDGDNIRSWFQSAPRKALRR